MKTIVDINPLKPGKLEAYKAFAREITGPKRQDLTEMFARYGLKTAEVFHHKIRDVDFIIVVHEAEDDVRERLEKFSTSNHPMEKWFVEQLSNLHDFESLNGEGQASKPVFSFRPFG
jgi:hypothetical protein